MKRREGVSVKFLKKKKRKLPLLLWGGGGGRGEGGGEMFLDYTDLGKRNVQEK